jgi:hypothetical protein
MNRFAEAAERKSSIGKIPGTNKFRKLGSNAAIYSQESGLDKITSDQYYPVGTKKNTK